MATTNGTLASKISSTVSSPTVHYAVSYMASRSSTSDKAVSITVTFSTKLNSSGSKLGTGIKLTAFIRVNGGAWKSVVLKSTSASWSGTAAHSASVTLAVSSTSSSTKVEFYISRTGSTVGGTAGTLSSASSPKKYTAALPPYTDVAPTPTPAPEPAAEKYVYIKMGGAWKKAVPYVKTGGAWKKTEPFVRGDGVWKEVG